MTLFVVCYDKCGTDHDYKPLTDDLKSMDSCHTQDSVWYVSRDCTRKVLFNRLKAHMHDKDRLMVVEFDKEPEWSKAFAGTGAWLRKHFP